MGATKKVSVTLAIEDADWAHEQAEATGESFSAVVSLALRRQRQSAARRSLLQELGTGDITQEDLDAARSEWG